MAEYIETRPETTGTRRAPRGGQNIAARLTNVVLGAWLFISAFLWIHTPASQTNSWILGVLIFAFGLLAMAVPPARFLNTAAAIWLFFSTLWIPHIYTGTAWHNAILAIVVFAVSLVPSSKERRVTESSGVTRRRHAHV